MIDHALALTHIDERGAARMVDVSEKPVTLRVAKASGLVIMKPSTLRMISDGAAAKGDVMAAARIAGIAAAKRTGDLIPLCHPLGLDAVSVTITPCEPDRVKILATTTTLGRTGVEMEALTAVSVAALTIYNMCKASIEPWRFLRSCSKRKAAAGPEFIAEVLLIWPVSPDK